MTGQRSVPYFIFFFCFIFFISPSFSVDIIFMNILNSYYIFCVFSCPVIFFYWEVFRFFVHKEIVKNDLKIFFWNLIFVLLKWNSVCFNDIRVKWGFQWIYSLNLRCWNEKTFFQKSHTDFEIKMSIVYIIFRLTFRIFKKLMLHYFF